MNIIGVLSLAYGFYRLVSIGLNAEVGLLIFVGLGLALLPSRRRK